MKDEIVDGVLKKSYLTKKGHVLRNWRRRWFVLRKTVLTYYASKARPLQRVTNSSYTVIVDNIVVLYNVIHSPVLLVC